MQLCDLLEADTRKTIIWTPQNQSILMKLFKMLSSSVDQPLSSSMSIELRPIMSISMLMAEVSVSSSDMTGPLIMMTGRKKIILYTVLPRKPRFNSRAMTSANTTEIGVPMATCVTEVTSMVGYSVSRNRACLKYSQPIGSSVISPGRIATWLKLMTME